jgi:hypothetical protein
MQQNMFPVGSGFDFLAFGFTKFGIGRTFAVIRFLFGVLRFGHVFLWQVVSSKN